jgi:hypothetical protein
MERAWTGARVLKRYVWFLGLALLLSCTKWDLPVQQDSLLDGLVAYYPLNGNGLDASGNNLSGQMINGATFGPDRRDANQSALLLDGVDDYFEIPDNAKLRPDSISISLWLRQINWLARVISTTKTIIRATKISSIMRLCGHPSPPILPRRVMKSLLM